MEYSIFQYPFSWLTASFFSMPRLLALFSVVPLFNRQALPGLLRIGVAFSFSVFLIPSLENESINVMRSGSGLFIIIIKEALLGFLIGFVISIPLWALDVAGVYVDNQRGASIASSINPLTGHDSSPLGEVFSQAAIVLLIISGGITMMLTIVYDSYAFWPVFKLLPNFSDQTVMVLLGLVDKLMRIAILLSAPVIFAMFLAELALGMVSRFVPQLQVFFLAMPLKSAIAFFILSVYMANLMRNLSHEIDAMYEIVLSVVKSIFIY